MPGPLELWSEYGDLYNEIVRPERKYAITHYLRTQWGPLLGAARLWFVVALRQRCFWNDKQDWCIVDLETLAREAGISLRTANRILSEADNDESRPKGYVSWFFTRIRRRRYSEQVGKTVNAPNRYHVLLDDPLTPRDQARLAHYLQAAVSGDSPTATLDALRSLEPSLHEALSAPISPPYPIETIPAAFVLDVVGACCPMPPQDSEEYVEIARTCSRLHNALTRPEHVYLGNQYFRLQWLPILGPTSALLVVNLRARCYWNERTGEIRETCRASWAELAREMGCTTRQLRNLRKKPVLENFVKVIGEGRGRSPTTFHVQMPDPLTDKDRQLFEQRLRAPAESVRDPETGQLALRLLCSPPPTNAEKMAPSGLSREETRRPPSQTKTLNAEVMASGKDKEEVLAPGRRKFWHIEGVGAEILARQGGNFGTNKVLVITFSTKGLAETTLSLSETGSKKAAAVALLTTLLDALKIREPGKSKLLSKHPPCASVAAWSLYALAQPGLRENKAGYVYRRLIAGDQPPAECLELVALPPSVWRAFYQARKLGRAELIAQEFRPAFQKWSSLLSSVWDVLSFAFLDLHRDSTPSRDDSLPGELRALLRGDEEIEHGNGWKICTPDLHNAYRLAHEVAQLELGDAVTVYLLDERGDARQLNAEVLAFRVRPLPRQAWVAFLEELRWQVPRQVFDRHWRRVRPLGVTADDGAECVVLGVFTEGEREWLNARQSALARRTLSGVLGRSVEVRFVVCVATVEATPAFT